MSTELSPAMSVGQIVVERPARSRVFEELKIDYCCGGKLPLTDACRKAGLDPQDVLAKIAQADAEADRDEAGIVDADTMRLSDLADHIEQVHHAFLRAELPRLDTMTEKVFRVHGEKDQRLAQVRQAFCGLKAELTSHMMKEEQILFPLIRQMEQISGPSAFHCGSIANPIQQMEAEHDSAGDALAILRVATDEFSPPEWACNTYRAMLDGLAHLERDMHQHIHKENNVLFPKALELERQVQAH